MKKRYRKFTAPTMRRSSRVFVNELNVGKAETVKQFLVQCHDVTQYFVDLFWQRKDFSSTLADLPTVHRACDRFAITTRLSQAMAKQAKETIRAGFERDGKNAKKPTLHRLTTTLYSHFVEVTPFTGSFDFAVKLIGSGAPRLVIPCKSTAHLNELVAKGFTIGKTIRLGWRDERLFVDFILEKERPAKKTEGRIVGMDSNYVNGLVFSDGQQIASTVVEKIRALPKRKKRTHAQVKSLVACALKKLNLSQVKTLVIEDLKQVKHGTRGKFSRLFNRRLSHWLYAYIADWLNRACEESGTLLERKNPAYTSQFCRLCHKWDRRNRSGEQFLCIHCGHHAHADFNAAKNLELLGLAGAYGLRSLQTQNSI